MKSEGAWAFIELELPREESEHKLKKEKNVDVENAVNYLKTIFWHYANNKQKYNYTRDQFSETVSHFSVVQCAYFVWNQSLIFVCLFFLFIPRCIKIWTL